eukprot:CAMPEP_0117429510 /NCGR_PEP_ID=MMETSP0758-20121206/9062_1 /TAXON_ID=63605 /ORGANISM="Percolomonas cosmopolitus, Strain AE-1 (ATCC 50343)" /LENGTH=406 /DNA_ID=CAMNT_0005216627 /DNA_START=18 /DNA_END=1234 /DNA_ORIENTATION=-
MVLQVCICGGGNGSHVSAGYIGAKEGEFKVNVFTRQPEDWQAGIKENGGMVVRTRKNSETEMKEIIGKINKVSSDISEVAPGSDIFLLGGPAHANPIYLKAIAPYVQKGAIVGALFAQGGFDWAASQALGDKMKDITLYGLQNIPWICKKIKNGHSCRMIGPKKVLRVAATPVKEADNVAKLMTKMFDIPCTTIPNFLSLTLTPSNQIIHPARFYGIFEGLFKWDGKSGFVQEKIPLLYDQVDKFSADCLQEVSDELQELKKKLLEIFPKNLNLTEVKDLGQRIIDQYGDDVKDRSSLQQIFCSNLGYRGCAVPTVPMPGNEDSGLVVPNVKSRLFIEDMPYGLVILINIGDIIGVKTPAFKKYLRYHQNLMNVPYLTDDNELNKELLPQTGAPAAYGITTPEQLV